MDKLISVIIPVYKVEKYLDRCLNSVIHQTYPNLEIILVDDGSPDNCPELCDEWARRDSRITVIHQQNKGLSCARNAGLQIASGEYIGFVDSDDWIAPDMYRTLYHLCEEHQADIACGDIYRCSEITPDMLIPGQAYVNGRHGLSRRNPQVLLYTQQEYMKKYFKIHSQETIHYMWNKLYRREIAAHIHFPEGLIDEDVEGFFQALVQADRIVCTSRIVYYYWENPDGISAKWFSHKQMDLLAVWEHVCRLSGDTGNAQWSRWARLNYDRAHLGLLCRMLLNDPAEEGLYVEEKRQLLSVVKEKYWILMKSHIPFSRKMILTGVCVSYSLTKKMYWMLWNKKRV